MPELRLPPPADVTPPTPITEVVAAERPRLVIRLWHEVEQRLGMNG